MPVTFTDEFRRYVIEYGPAAALTLIAVILEEQTQDAKSIEGRARLLANALKVRNLAAEVSS